ncbi:MAG: discoidin domain-containing protein, partial [Deltaproteobacteria bacterium]|nr:discoidin domain-containing protein [Deltaproteobacteria bacterium]
MSAELGKVLREERRYLTALAASIAVGLALRIWLAFAADGKSWSDSATIALMAMHAMRGKFYAFYWGQTYMGSLEPLVVAPFFALLGVSDVTLSVGLLPWYVLFAVALYLVVRRCGGPLAAAISGWLLALAPPYVQYQQIIARGGYTETLAFGTTLLWLTLRVTHGGLEARVERRHLLAIGFVAGLAFWTNWLVFPYFAVVGVYLLLHDWRLPLRPRALGALLCFLLGSLPFWVYNLRHGFPTFSFVEGFQGTEGRHQAFEYAVQRAIPLLFGFRDLEEKFAWGWPGRALTNLLALGLCVLLLGLWRSWLALLRGRLRATHPVIALLLLMLATVGIYAFGLPGRYHVARYLLPVATAAASLLALAGAWLTARSRALGAAALLGLLALYGLQIAEFRRNLASSARPGTEGLVDQLAEHLLRSGIRYGYADYGDSTITTYLTRERVVLADYTGGRYPVDEVDFHDPALILRESNASADDTLDALGASFAVSRIPGFRIYWPIRYDGVARAPLPTRGWTVAVSENGADAGLMLDGDRWTYWSVPKASVAPAVTLDLGAEQSVTGVYFDLGERGHDGFAKLRIEASRDGESWSAVKEAGWGFAAQLDPNGQVTCEQSGGQYVLFPPRPARRLRFTRLAGNGKYDWSVGELRVLGPG